MVRQLLSFLTLAALCGCAGPTSLGPTALAPGMTRQQVVAVMGLPSGFASGPGGAECLTFDVRQTPLSVSPMTLKQEVVLRNGVLVSSATSSPLQAWGADAITGSPKATCG